MSTKYSGADWIKDTFKVNLSTLGEKVADVLGQVYQGIYHIDKLIRKVDWGNKTCIEVPIDGQLSSYDNAQLTLLLILCFDNMLRVEISARTFRLITLRFHVRKTRDGRLFERLPELDTLINDLREKYALQKTQSE